MATVIQAKGTQRTYDITGITDEGLRALVASLQYRQDHLPNKHVAHYFAESQALIALIEGALQDG